MWLSFFVACTTMVHVQASHPEAEVGIMRSGVRPHDQYLQAPIRGTGEASGRVTYSSFDHFWAWARVPGAKPTVQQIPSVASPGPIVGCVLGVVIWPALVSCFFVSKPSSALLVLEVREPQPIVRTPPLAHIETVVPALGDPTLVMDVGARLAQLKALHEQGLVTDEEYQQKRQQLLDEL